MPDIAPSLTTLLIALWSVALVLAAWKPTRLHLALFFVPLILLGIGSLALAWINR